MRSAAQSAASLGSHGIEVQVSDIANAIYKHLRTMAPHQLERLTAIQLKEAADEIARLRLTDGERRALEFAIGAYPLDDSVPATLRSLLDRTK